MDIRHEQPSLRRTMKLAVDVGYGYVKAINDKGQKVSFPSYIAPYQTPKLEGFQTNSRGHICEIFDSNGARKYFVGESALWESNKISFTLQKERYLHPSHDVLLQTAIALLNLTPDTAEETELVLGLPIDYYRHQKNGLQAHVLKNINAAICIDGLETIIPTISNVLIYPQGLGTLVTINDLPLQGLFALIDIGYKTSDYLVCKVEKGKALPISQLSGSIEIGSYSVLTDLIYYFADRTGGTLDHKEALEALQNQHTFYQGVNINLSEQIAYICQNTARSLADRINSRWGDQSNFIQKTYLTGGGAVQLPQILPMFPNCEVVSDPQWSNVYGFMKSINS